MRDYLHRVAIAATAVILPATMSAVTTNVERAQGVAAAHYADSVYKTLSLRERVGQLVFAKAVPTGGEASKATVRRFIETDGCGGLLFTEGKLKDHVELAAYAQTISKVPVMITFDGEWGLSMRISDSPRFPHNMALGAISDYKLLYRYGKEVAREFRAAGVHVNFAPDADVNSNPANPVIGYRSFGEDPERVGKATVAYSLGLEDGGVQSVSKHFPGHGDTDADSHKALPVVHHSRARLDSTDLRPFADYIEAGCSGVMVGHIAVPALDPSGRPASLSKIVTDGLLRDEMGFEGLIYTDALGMRGAADYTDNPALEALKAGADVLLCPSNASAAIKSITAAVESGKIDESLIEEHCKRVLRYKYLYNAGETPKSYNAALYQAVNNPEAQALIDELSAASITVLTNKDNLLPLDLPRSSKVSIINIGAKADNEFSDICSHYANTESHFTMSSAFAPATLARITDADVVVAAVYTDTPEAREAFAQVVSKAKKSIAVFFVNPYKMKKFAASLGKVDALVLGYDDIPSERRSAAEALFGGIAVSGKLPVALKGVASLGQGIELPKTRLGFSSVTAAGMSSWLPDSIDALVNNGLASEAFPGCQVLVAKDGNIVFSKAYGKLTSGGTAKVNRRTVYDLASVSKAAGTLPGIMKAYDEGLFSLDDSLSNLLPEITDPGKKSITVRSLLYHETGMPASLNVFNAMFDTLSYTGKLTSTRRDRTHSIKIQNRVYGHNTARLRKDILSSKATEKFPVEAAKGIYTGKVTYDTLMQRIYNIALRDNRNYNYSCLNFCMLMALEERATGRNHREYVNTEIFEPLGAYRTDYRASEWTDNVAPTEHDSFMRRQTLKGYTHDELAAMSGGVQGNAGLFANADDLAKYCQMLLNGGSYGGKQILSTNTATLFTTAKSATCRRGLGFDKPDKENADYSPTCEEASAEVFGHLGFTGTVFWVDPTENLIFIFLTNRVNPTRDNAAFNRLNIRPRLFSLVYKSLGKGTESTQQ